MRKTPEDNIGYFFRLRDRGWHSLKRHSIVYVEKYGARRREFIVYSYADNKRYAVPLLDFTGSFFYCNPQPKMEKS